MLPASAPVAPDWLRAIPGTHRSARNSPAATATAVREGAARSPAEASRRGVSSRRQAHWSNWFTDLLPMGEEDCGSRVTSPRRMGADGSVIRWGSACRELSLPLWVAGACPTGLSLSSSP